MNLRYESEKQIDPQQLISLFRSVGWKSADCPELLPKAMAGSDWVVTAWDGENLVGLANALSDRVMTVYYHWVLVNPAYQGRGIGRELMDRMKEHYSYCRTQLLVAYREAEEFYLRCGFSSENSIPMYISDLI